MILNLTQHPATPEQLTQGVVDLPADARAALVRYLTVDTLPTEAEIDSRARGIATLVYATGADNAPTSVMVGGAPWMMRPLVTALHAEGVVQCLAAFSRRESVEHTDPTTGAVTKTAVFRHAGFVPM